MFRGLTNLPLSKLPETKTQLVFTDTQEVSPMEDPENESHIEAGMKLNEKEVVSAVMAMESLLGALASYGNWTNMVDSSEYWCAGKLTSVLWGNKSRCWVFGRFLLTSL